MLLHKKYSPDSILAAVDVSEIMALVHTHPDIAGVKTRVTQHLYALVEEGKARGDFIQHISTELMIHNMFCTLRTLQSSYHDRDAAFWRDHLDEKIDEQAAWFMRSIAPPTA
jgi:hypothetical protein